MNSLLLFAAFTLAQAGHEPAVSVLSIPRDGHTAALRPTRRAGLRDVLLFSPEGVALHLQDERGVISPEPSATFPWPSEHLVWDVVDLGGDGLFEVLTLDGQGRVAVQGVDESGAFREPRAVLEGQSYLPRGVSRMRFARDVNDDGRLDLVLPAGGKYRVYLQREDGAFGKPLEIEYDAEVEYLVGDPKSLEASFEQSVSIPLFRLEDVDGDGLQDLVSSTEERVDFHLARPTISSTPTWSLDLLAFEDALPKHQGIDFDDLFTNIEQGVQWKVAELDGEAPRDLVLQLGSTIYVYLGGSARGVDEGPDSVLKLSGHLLRFFLRDVQGSELADLQLLRGERIGLGQALRLLVLPGSIDFEVFTYRNEGGSFSRKPTRRNTIALGVPRLLTIMEESEQIEDYFDAQISIPTTRADLDGDGVATDVVDHVGGRLIFYRDCSPEERYSFSKRGSLDLDGVFEVLVLEDLDGLEDGGTKSIDLGAYKSWNFAPGVALRAAVRGKAPDTTLAADVGTDSLALRVLDLDGDGRDDVVVWASQGDGTYKVQFVVQGH